MGKGGEGTNVVTTTIDGSIQTLLLLPVFAMSPSFLRRLD